MLAIRGRGLLFVVVIIVVFHDFFLVSSLRFVLDPRGGIVENLKTYCLRGNCFCFTT